MSTRKYISRLAIGGICTAVALAASACGAGGPAASTPGTAGTNTVNVLVEAGGHAELDGRRAHAAGSGMDEHVLPCT